MTKRFTSILKMTLFPRIVALIFFLFSFNSINAQIEQVSKTISSGGGKSDVEAYSNFAVLGESFVTTSSQSGVYRNSIGFVNTTELVTSVRSIHDLHENLTVYPNPASDIVFITSQNYGLIQFEIIGLTGELLNKGSIEGKLDIKTYSPGIYYLRIKNKQGELIGTQKLVIYH